MNAEKTFFKQIVKEYMVPDRLPLIAINTFLAGYFFGQNGVATFTYLLPLYFLFIIAGTWVNFGAFSLSMKAVGNNEKDFAQAYSHLALRVSIISGILLTALVFIFFEEFLTLLKIPPDLWNLAEPFGKTLAAVGILLVLSCYVLQFLKVAGMQKQLKLIYKVMLAINAGVAYSCVKFLNFGMEGLALGMGAATLFCIVFEGKRLYKFFGMNLIAPISEPFTLLKNLLRAGNALALSKIFSLSQIFLFNLICYKFYGVQGVAVFGVLQIAIRLCRIASSMTFQALTPMLLVEIGDKNIKAMMLTLKETLRRGLVFAAFIPMAILWGAADWLATKTSLDSAWYALLIEGFHCYSLSLILAVINAVFIIAFLCLGQNLFSNLIAFLRSFFLLIVFLWGIAADNPELLWWCFLFAEAGAFLFLVAGIFFLQKTQNLKTPLLLDAKIFRPSAYFVLSRAENSLQSVQEKISAFVSKNVPNLPAENISKKLQDWLKIFDENSPRKKEHLTAVHLYKDGENLKITLRDNGKRFNYNAYLQDYPERENFSFKYALGLNNIYFVKEGEQNEKI